jgi:hypothetical protein
MKRLIAIITMIVVLLLPAVAFSCSSGGEEPAIVKAQLWEPFTFGIGYTAEIEAESLKIKFVGVISDSRCPRGVECITAGEVKMRMLISIIDSPAEVILTQLGNSTATDYFLQYKLQFRISPITEKDKTIYPEQYSIRMTVTK